MKKIFLFYRSAREEWSKVIEPTKEQIRNASISVLVVVAIVTLYLALLDVIFHNIMSSILGV